MECRSKEFGGPLRETMGLDCLIGLALACLQLRGTTNCPKKWIAHPPTQFAFHVRKQRVQIAHGNAYCVITSSILSNRDLVYPDS